MINFLKKNYSKITAAALAVGALVVGASVNAQVVADAEVGALADLTAETMKVNILSILTDNIGFILAAGLAVLAITFIWKFTKRFLGGK